MVGFSIGLMHVSVTNAGNGKARLKSYLDIITSVYKSAQVVASFVDLQMYSTDLQPCFPVDAGGVIRCAIQFAFFLNNTIT